MDYRELLGADVAVDMKLLTPEQAAKGLDDLSREDRARVEEKVARLMGETNNDARLALARRGMDRKLHASLAPKVSHEVSDAGARVRAPLRTLTEDRYTGFLPLGEGGMGIVYLALDTELNRKVAFKMVRADTAGPLDETQHAIPEDTETRFLQEAWVTGGLEHPGIVPVYELGRTPSGVPYYTMRVIRGERTLETAIEEATTAEDRLALLEPFLKVCDAIRYAHSRSIIHRDLKPANIALGPFGEVVVLDWGLAKMHDRPDITASRWQSRLEELRSETDLETLTSSMGTPGYMAPEAALGEVDRVDSRSDIYSLGAILYRILAGRLPIRFSNYVEFVQNVSEKIEEVPGAPEGLARVCLKALSTEPEARQQSVDGFSNAIRAWQAESAVEREVSVLTEQARVALLAAETMEGEALLREVDRALAVASRIRELRPDHEGAAALLEKARALRTRAIAESEAAMRKTLLRRVGVVGLITATAATIIVALMLNARRQEAEDARVEALRERARAEQLATFMLGDLRNGLRPIGRLDLLGKVARKSLNYYETLPQRDASTTDRRARAIALRNVGEVLAVTGDLDRAEASYRTALAIFEELQQGRYVIECLLQIGDIERLRGELALARTHFERAHGIAKRIAESQETHQAWQQLAACINVVGVIEEAEGNIDTALAMFQESLSITGRVTNEDPENTAILRSRSASLHRIANIQTDAGKLKLALANYRLSLDIGQALAKKEPQNLAWQRSVMISLRQIGWLEREKARANKRELDGFVTAAPYYYAALEIARRLSNWDPTNGDWLLDLSGLLRMVGQVQRKSNEMAAAEKSLGEALEIARRLVLKDPSNRKWVYHLSAVLRSVGDFEFSRRNFKETKKAYGESLDLAKRLVKEKPDHLPWRDRLAGCYIRAGDIAERLDDYDGALAHFEAALVVARRLSARDQNHSLRKRAWALALVRKGKVLQAHGAKAESEAVLRKAVEVHAAVVGLAPHRQKEHDDYWVASHRISALLAGTRKVETSRDHWDVGHALKRRGEYRTAVEHMSKAFEDPKMYVIGTIYSAACAAALVSGDGAQGYHKTALFWLDEDLKLTHTEIKRLAGVLADKSIPATELAALTRKRNGHIRHLKWAHQEDPDFANLRDRADFQALFKD